MQPSLQNPNFSPEFNMIKSVKNANSDSELWKAFQSGDRIAFEKIYNNSIQHLTNYAMRIVSDKEIVQDAIQDIFVHLWNKRKELAPVSSIRFYLMKAVRRDVIRKMVRASKKSSLSYLSGNSKVDFQPSYEMIRIIDEESSARLLSMRRELDSLTPKQKEVLYLKYYSNLTNDEIAEVLEINKQSVYNNIYRALEVLRGKLNLLPIVLSSLGSFGIQA